MTGQQLKNSILQMAVQGKLVPQDPNDEPASVLLERIRAEKEALIKNGKIKKEKIPSVIFRGADNLPYEKVGKNEPVCIADEIPFDIPDSWEWVRIKNIGKNVNDAFADGPFGSNLKKEHYTTNREVRLIQLSNIGENGWRNENTKYTTYKHAQTLSRSMVRAGCIVIAKMMPAGRAIIVPDIEKDYILSSDAVKFLPHEDLNINYLSFAINSPVFRNQVSAEAHGVTRVRTSLGKLQTYFLPIPPIEEQKRIVLTLKRILPYVDKYEVAEIKRNELKTIFPDLLKKSILQEAVQGKLVPQDENDEPASVLLERIRAEKQALIKAGKIKKDKNESVIFRRDNSHYEKLNGIERCIDDEIPFEIPDNWCWCRLSEIATVIRGLTFSTSSKEKKDGLSLVLRGGNIDSKTEKLSFIDNIYVDTKIIKDIQFLRKSDTLIVASSGTKSSVGKSCYIDKDLNNVSFGGFMMTVRPNVQIAGEYIAINIKLYRQKIIASTAGYISNITNPILNNLLIPLPPIEEQKRIIESISTLMSQIQKL